MIQNPYKNDFNNYFSGYINKFELGQQHKELLVSRAWAFHVNACKLLRFGILSDDFTEILTNFPIQ